MTDVDYWISKVCYNSENTHIVKVEIYKQGEVSPGNEKIWTKESVINYLKKRYNIWTMTKQNGKWITGEKVQIVKIKDKEYIKTVKDSKRNDNLGSLPRFKC